MSGALFDELSDLDLAQPCYRESPALANQVAYELTQLPRLPDLGIAVSANDHDGRVFGLARDEAQHLERRLIGIVEIVDDD